MAIAHETTAFTILRVT